MIRSLPPLFAFTVICLSISSANSQPLPNSTAAQKCLELAASPFDSNRPPGISGIPFGSLDPAAAEPVCREAHSASADDPLLTFAFARSLNKAGKFAEAVALYRGLADKGHLGAIHNLAALYIDGEGVAKDERTAAELLRRTENYADGLSLTLLADLLLRGFEGTPASPEKALDLYDRAGRLNNVSALQKAANLLEAGKGSLKPDIDAAVFRLRRAFSLGRGAQDGLRLAQLIKSGKIPPEHPNEVTEIYRTVAATDDIDQLLKVVEAITPDWPSDLVHLAGQTAYRIIDKASSDGPPSEETWPPYLRYAVVALAKAIDQGMQPRNTEEWQRLLADYGQGGTLKLTTDLKCKAAAERVNIVLWDWTRDRSTADMQFEWWRAVRGCVASDATRRELETLFQESRKSAKSYVAVADTHYKKQADAERRDELWEAGNKLRSGDDPSKWDFATALKNFQELVDAGDWRGSFGLFRAHLLGEGAQVNITLAAQHLRKVIDTADRFELLALDPEDRATFVQFEGMCRGYLTCKLQGVHADKIATIKTELYQRKRLLNATCGGETRSVEFVFDLKAYAVGDLAKDTEAFSRLMQRNPPPAGCSWSDRANSFVRSVLDVSSDIDKHLHHNKFSTGRFIVFNSLGPALEYSARSQSKSASTHVMRAVIDLVSLERAEAQDKLEAFSKAGSAIASLFLFTDAKSKVKWLHTEEHFSRMQVYESLLLSRLTPDDGPGRDGTNIEVCLVVSIYQKAILDRLTDASKVTLASLDDKPLQSAANVCGWIRTANVPSRIGAYCKEPDLAKGLKRQISFCDQIDREARRRAPKKL